MNVKRKCLYERIVEIENGAFRIDDVKRMIADGIFIKICFLGTYVGVTAPTINLFKETNGAGDNVGIPATPFMNVPDSGFIVNGNEDIQSIVIDNSAVGCVRFLIQLWRIYCE